MQQKDIQTPKVIPWTMPAFQPFVNFMQPAATNQIAPEAFQPSFNFAQPIISETNQVDPGFRYPDLEEIIEQSLLEV
jgi:hypothetical protein